MLQFLLFSVLISPNSQTRALLSRGPSPGSEAQERFWEALHGARGQHHGRDSTMPGGALGEKQRLPHPAWSLSMWQSSPSLSIFPCAFHPLSVHCPPHGQQPSLRGRNEEPRPSRGERAHSSRSSSRLWAGSANNSGSCPSPGL